MYMDLTPEQKSIITTKNKTMLVAASAGSGKTFVVVERIINSIVNDKIDIDSMLIVTFTNAAASELRERIVKKLQEALSTAQNMGDTALAYHISRQINKAWSANISTIHSFCLSVIKDNFYILGIDPNVSTVDAAKANLMLTEAINEVIEEEYENSSEAFLDMLEVLGSEEELVAFTEKLYEFYSHITDKEEFRKKVLDIYSMKDVEDLSRIEVGERIIQDIQSKLKLSFIELKNVISSLDGYDEFLKHKLILETLQGNIQNILNETKYDKIREKCTMADNLPNMPRYNGTDTETKENILNIKKRIVENIRSFSKIMYKDTAGIIEEQNKMLPCITWIFEFIQKVKKVYAEKKQKKCVIDFADYEELALEALSTPEVAERYRQKFKAIYVDEYQDTSYAQEAVISKIASPTNCIMVGDVKQSIYGFRNAAPELFSSKYEKFNDITEAKNDSEVKIVLAQNFRSRREVIDSINDIFEKIMTLEFGGARYTQKETLKYGEGYKAPAPVENIDYTTEINLVERNKEEKEELEDELEQETSIEQEARLVARRIKKLVKEFVVYDKDKKEYRKCEYKDIVILLQVMAGVGDKITEVLKKEGVPAYSNSKVSFYETAEIKLVMDFLKVLNNPLDDIPLVSVMYSKIGMFTLDDLVEIRSWDSASYVYNAVMKYEEKCKDEVLKKKIQKFLDLVNKFRLYAKTYTISESIVLLYTETGIYDQVLLDTDGKQKQINMDALVQIAKDYETVQTATMYSFVQYIENIRKKEGASEGPRVIGENENVVRIMTVHHSKGLEFPVVILMNMARPFRFPDIKDRVLLDTNLGIGISVLDKELGITYPSIVNMGIKANIKYKQKSELLRLLYVALTRAKEKIIIYGTVKNAEKYLEEIYTGISDGVVSQAVLEQNNSHLKNILMGLLASNKESYELNVVRGVAENETVSQELSPKEVLDSLQRELKDKVDNKKLESLMQSVEPKYEYESSKEILKKYTATALNKEVEDTDLSVTEESPKVLKKELDSASFGTCVHKIIELTDLVHADYASVMENTAKVLDEFKAQNLNQDALARRILAMIECLKNNKILTEQSKVEKEYEFVMRDSLKGIVQSELAEPSLVQGVIDMYIETESRSVIVDFKTDRVKTEAELIERYLPQLTVYKRGIKLALNHEAEVYIYSFALDKLIRVAV